MKTSSAAFNCRGRSLFPRSYDRGLIEDRNLVRHVLVRHGFPRSYDRGLIEETMSDTKHVHKAIISPVI